MDPIKKYNSDDDPILELGPKELNQSMKESQQPENKKSDRVNKQEQEKKEKEEEESKKRRHKKKGNDFER